MTKAHEIAMERQKAHAWVDDNIVEVVKLLKETLVADAIVTKKRAKKP